MMAGDDMRFPPILKEFEKKQYLITLVPTKDNIKKESNAYVAKYLGEPLELLDTHNPDEVKSPQVVELTNMEPESEPTLNNLTTPPTGKSTTKTRTRRNKALIETECDESQRFAKIKKNLSFLVEQISLRAARLQ
ncbi:hypothetical protein AgCh_005025 [Apium graveolens]